MNGELEPVLMELVAKGSKMCAMQNRQIYLSQQLWRMHTEFSVFITTREAEQSE